MTTWRNSGEEGGRRRTTPQSEALGARPLVEEGERCKRWDNLVCLLFCRIDFVLTSLFLSWTRWWQVIVLFNYHGACAMSVLLLFDVIQSMG